MILGMSVSAFTQLHVALSLAGIAAGFAVLVGLLRSHVSGGTTAVFLITTILTSATGFLFPATAVLPSHVVGAVSLAALAVAVVALYNRRLEGPWRAAYVASAMLSLYLNVFVLVVQAFQKIAFLNALAPTQSAPPFVVTQGVVLALFVWLGFRALRSFHPVAV